MGKALFSFNTHYFDLIDDEHKAYWLGFILADGTLHHDIRKRVLKTTTTMQERKYLSIAISTVDIRHLEKFRFDIQSNHPIHVYRDTSSFGNGKVYNTEYCRIQLENEHFADNLIRLGVVPNKTFRIVYPLINPDLDRHFIRGFFDGNGCITNHLNKKGCSSSISYELNITSTFEMCRILGMKLDIHTKFYQRFPERGTDNYTIRQSGNYQVYRVLNYLYKYSTVYLDRKYQKYLELENMLLNRGCLLQTMQ